MEKDILGNKKLVHLSIVVNDIEKTSQDYADFFGISKPKWFWTGNQEAEHTQYRGEPTEGRAKLAFLSVDSLVIELIEPDEKPSIWREYLDKHGEGVHHIGFAIEGMENRIAALTGNGMPLLQRGGEEEKGWYAYMDTNEKLKVMLELLEGYK